MLGILGGNIYSDFMETDKFEDVAKRSEENLKLANQRHGAYWDSLYQENATLSRKISEEYAKYGQLKRSNDELEEANKEYASAYNVLQSQNEECRNQQEECISNLNSTNQELAESKISIDSLKSKYGYLNQNCNQMLESYQDSVATLLDDLKKCEESSQNRFSMETEFALVYECIFGQSRSYYYSKQEISQLSDCCVQAVKAFQKHNPHESDLKDFQESISFKCKG
ncbi:MULTISPECIES: hypothetical protein [Hallerella]|uniref:Chromosome partition protein Smc n=1 Tax=Hallerella porci TaxID=1945871 RepID=A0ABX5LK16_9BACT|nr:MULTISPECIES: hypothetical protein [Hallerella]PWK93357.1 hypothetical protein B0H50_12837 [Hallerella porci]